MEIDVENKVKELQSKIKFLKESERKVNNAIERYCKNMYKTFKNNFENIKDTLCSRYRIKR